MIKISKYIYINALTVVIFIICYINRTLETAVIAYVIMTIHELFHLIAAKIIGLKAANITFQPFGLNLKLKNRYIYSTAEEIVLYLAGPFANILMAAVCVICMKFGGQSANEYVQYFYMYNILLFAANMLPILPLDGGIILKKLLMYKLGMKRALFIMRSITCFFIGLISLFTVYTINYEGANYSLICMVIFLLGNIATQKEKYNIDFIKELVYYKSKKLKGKKAVVRVIKQGENIRKSATEFTTGTYTILIIIDEDGNICDIITEQQAIESLLKPV